MTAKYDDKRPTIPAATRRNVKVTAGHKCSIKDCNEHTYLEIHHINLNREDNKEDNLILLCDKHHKMAHKGVIDNKSLKEYKRLLINGHKRTPISTTEIKKIANTVFEDNFIKLKGQAKTIANDRAAEISGVLLQRLQLENPSVLGNFVSPHLQDTLFHLQKVYAKTGDSDLGNFLVELIVERAKNETRSLYQIVLDESILVAPKLNKGHLDILALVFLIRTYTYRTAKYRKELMDLVCTYIYPLLNCIPQNEPDVEYLMGLGCLTGSDKYRFYASFTDRHRAFFMETFTLNEFSEKIGNHANYLKLIEPIDLSNDSYKLIGLLREDYRNSLKGGTGSKIKEFQNLNLNLGNYDLTHFLNGGMEFEFRSAERYWETCGLDRAKTSAVGKMIAKVHLEKHYGLIISEELF